MMTSSYSTTTVTGMPFSPGPTTTVIDTFLFNDAGVLLVKGFQSDETGDGIFDSSSWIYNTVNDQNQIVETVIADDWTGDGRADTYATAKFAYDEAGQGVMTSYAFDVAVMLPEDYGMQFAEYSYLVA